MKHYHISWSPKSGKILDWERFKTPEEAKNSAEQLVQPGEKYSIEQFNSDCPRCAEATERVLKKPNTRPCYAWDYVVRDALTEKDAEQRFRKVAKAQRQLSNRLCKLTSADTDEQNAIRDAVERLRLISQPRKRKSEPGDKEEIA